MTSENQDWQKEILADTLNQALSDLRTKVDGLCDYDRRRPMTTTGTNLLGLIKHVASITIGYFGVTFDRDPGIELLWFTEEAEEGADLWVPADESTDYILDLYARSQAVAQATIDALDLDCEGYVPWWHPDKRHVTLTRILVHCIAEIQRHAGHADILRELIDGEVGRYPGDVCIPDITTDQWAAYRAQIDAAARQVDPGNLST
ncbi:MAG: DinB family protein [Propionibacteriaceae bacterium]|nr:DinB family protein [Propionibacteriaceae bacterium]